MPAGLVEFKNRKSKNSNPASHKLNKVELPSRLLEIFKENKKAWKNFQGMPSGYRKQCIWYVIHAKREETKVRRLNILIDNSVKGDKIPQLKPGRK